MSWNGSLPKPSRTARTKLTRTEKLARRHAEDEEKRKVRRRDRTCRFPLCGCHTLRLRLEVAHIDHKGMGGNPEGDRSTADRMVYLCVHRHQDGRVSFHKGTLQAKPLTPDGFDGPVAWRVDAEVLFPGMYHYVHKSARWAEVGRESAPGVLEEGLLTAQQRRVLEQLARMDL